MRRWRRRHHGGEEVAQGVVEKATGKKKNARQARDAVCVDEKCPDKDCIPLFHYV
tara:strand:- start:9 stop:173 length:165 start_codon:yes stop_codon:yes gene_type:complete